VPPPNRASVGSQFLGAVARTARNSAFSGDFVPLVSTRKVIKNRQRRDSLLDGANGFAESSLLTS